MKFLSLFFKKMLAFRYAVMAKIIKKNNKNMNSKSVLSSIAITCFISSVGSNPIHSTTPCKCYGISGPGENDCDALDHSEHTCGGASTRDRHIGDWKMTESADACKKAGGLLESEARKRLGLPPSK
jgi:uncharacterized membrane protein